MVNTLFFFFLPVSGPAAVVHDPPLKKLFSLATTNKFPTIESALFLLKSNTQRCAVRPAFQKNSTVSQGRPLHSELEKKKWCVWARAGDAGALLLRLVQLIPSGTLKTEASA